MADNNTAPEGNFAAGKVIPGSAGDGDVTNQGFGTRHRALTIPEPGVGGVFADEVQQHFYAALASLPVPVSQPPGDAQADTWVTFNEIAADARTAGNAVTRICHLVQLHAWSHCDNDDHRVAFFAAIELLKAAGVRVFSWGPDDYEQDTGIHHIACTCEWWQR